jgi:hypothetical protein
MSAGEGQLVTHLGSAPAALTADHSSRPETGKPHAAALRLRTYAMLQHTRFDGGVHERDFSK